MNPSQEQRRGSVTVIIIAAGQKNKEKLQHIPNGNIQRRFFFPFFFFFISFIYFFFLAWRRFLSFCAADV